jgi:hypothetical protein
MVVSITAITNNTSRERGQLHANGRLDLIVEFKRRQLAVLHSLAN